MPKFVVAWLPVFLCVGAVDAFAQDPGTNLVAPSLWVPGHAPFSFKYGGKESAQFLATWQTAEEPMRGSSGQVRRYSYTDPATKLRVTAEVRLFSDNPQAVDWVLSFRNLGHADTPILEDVLPLDLSVPALDDSILRHDRGSDGTARDFEPLEERIPAGGSVHLESSGGDSSSVATLPFFNLQTGDHGVIGAIGCN